ncbi:MAG: methylated-DNA--[protein]-cysteine S-methyltransferase [Oscillospiraceae bacterium]|jgi:methylated-DNA-[protein]-cysteine S-methyltransferase|nr:methylated-DNA--[protein]-cysteine S-methyltransferase [Oscillospiraceae bacterium]
MAYIHSCPSPLGSITLSSDGEALTGLWFEGQTHFGSTLSGGEEDKPLPLFDRTEEWLKDYFSGRDPGAAPPLAPKGTPFQRAVWQLLLDIPYGDTVTYGRLSQRLAERMGRKSMSPQAVGGAVGRNPISILIPCHRVVGSGGSLTGYAGGLERKILLLKREGVPLTQEGRVDQRGRRSHLP